MEKSQEMKTGKKVNIKIPNLDLSKTGEMKLQEELRSGPNKLNRMVEVNSSFIQQILERNQHLEEEIRFLKSTTASNKDLEEALTYIGGLFDTKLNKFRIEVNEMLKKLEHSIEKKVEEVEKKISMTAFDSKNSKQ